MTATSFESLQLKEGVALCLEAKRRQNSPTGIHALESHGRAFVSIWGDRELGSLTTAEIEEWIVVRRSKVADGTILQQLSFLSAVFTNLSGLQNPVQSVSTRLRLGKRSRRLSATEEASLAAAYRAVMPDGELEWAAPRFALMSGCRRLEQLMLRHGDVRRPTEPGKPGELFIRRGKSGQRTVPLHPEAVSLALAWSEISQAEGSPWIFWPEQPSEDVKVRCHHGFAYHTHKFMPALKEAGIKGLQWRDLRRTYACRMIEGSVPIFDIQQLLGHSSPKQTLTYCHAQYRQLEAAVMKLY